MTSPRSVATMLSLCSSPTSSEDRALLGSNPSAARGTKREGRATHSRSPLHPHAWDQSEKSQGVRGTESPASSAWDALRKAEGARPSCCDNYLDTYRLRLGETMSWLPIIQHARHRRGKRRVEARVLGAQFKADGASNRVQVIEGGSRRPPRALPSTPRYALSDPRNSTPANRSRPRVQQKANAGLLRPSNEGDSWPLALCGADS